MSVSMTLIDNRCASHRSTVNNDELSLELGRSTTIRVGARFEMLLTDNPTTAAFVRFWTKAASGKRGTTCRGIPFFLVPSLLRRRAQCTLAQCECDYVPTGTEKLQRMDVNRPIKSSREK